MKDFICFLGLMAIICSKSFGQGVTDVVIQGPTQANVGETVQFEVWYYSNGNQISPPSSGGYFWENSGMSNSTSSMNSLIGQFTQAGNYIVGYEYSNAGNYYFDSFSISIVGDYCSNVTASAPDGSRLGTGSVLLSADPAPAGFSYVWYDTNQTTLVYTSKDFPTPTLSNTKTYYLGYKHTATNCISALVPVKAQINDYNSVKKYSARTATSNKNSIITGGPSISYKTFNYSDGIGRPIQTVLKQQTVNGKDLIYPMDYDQFGRQVLEFLPYYEGSGTQDGRFRTNGIAMHASQTNAIYGDTFGYSEKQFEPTPLNNIDKQAAPGNSWKMGSGKELKFFRRPNTTNDQVRIFTIDTNGLPITSSAYAENSLWTTIVDDEDNKRTIQYLDKQGRIVLKKVQNTALSGADGHNGWLCTYYVYDDLGQLRVVIPPKAVEILITANWSSATSTNANLANEQYFRYTYDIKGRLVEKYIPGKGLESMLYDNQDRLVGFQDANMAPVSGNKEWLYNKYDGLGRIVLTGKIIENSNRVTLQGIINNLSGNNAEVKQNTAKIKTGTTISSSKYDGYQEYVASSSITLQNGFNIKATSNQSFTARIGTLPASGETGAWPMEEGEILTVNYYDSYNFLPGMDFQNPGSPFVPVASTKVHGLLTGKKVKNLETGEFYATAIYYDDQERVIQTLSQHQRGATIRSSTAYNFEGLPTRNLTTNSLSSNYTVLRIYAYNVAGLLESITHTLGNGSSKTLAQYTYDDLGRPKQKTFPFVASNANQTFSFNIRDWIKDIGTDYNGIFTQSIGYNSTTINNGNIAQVSWVGGQNTTTRTYTYSYDNANRIKAAAYTGASGENYSLSSIGYDGNGNILTMKRNNQRTSSTWGEVDNLTYSYFSNSNRLSQVSDGITNLGYLSNDFKEQSATVYGYDLNGNLKSNLDKKISLITYNHLNLPEEISLTTGGKVKFTYDAEGSKLTQKVYNSSGTLTKTQDYLGEVVLLDGALDYINHEEGRIVAENSELWSEFFVKDHLGNVRQVLRSPVSQSYIATMESGRLASEEMEFSMVSESRQTEPAHNVTKDGNQVAWLNAKRGRMVGPGRTQEIYAGDSLKLQVYGKYLEVKKQKSKAASFMAAGGKERLLADLNELTLNNQRAGGANPIALLNLVDILAKDIQKKEVPEAYLMYALYDQDSNRYEVGKKVLSKNASNQHEILEEEMYISKDGYLETFVVNETSMDVWFDNMMVMSISPAVVQETHYDPWGVELKGLGFQYASIKTNKYLFNGKELIEDNNLQYYDYGARMYDPTIGRWGVVDPMAEHPNQLGMSPYSAMWNNPIIFTDPDGKCPDCPDPSTAKEGDTANPHGEREYTFSDGKWTAEGGTLDEFVFTPEKDDPESSSGASSKLLTIGGIVSTLAGTATEETKGLLREVLNNFNSLQKESEVYDLGLNYSDEISRSAKVLRNLSRIGTGMTYVGGLMAIGQFANSDKSYGDYTKLGMNSLIFGLTVTPEPISTGIGIGLGLLEAGNQFQQLYDYADKIENRGFIVVPIPITGGNTIIKIK
ncbi:DUF6443 domain-containing protein [Algoriphagus pacificus]|uniref:RHS repeat-associated core domain-containing protein n=1 Tax=Algoriphagus pacificus TaxID=2811234 RepID=A0ABS3CK28_9BACT|nr:DUF6443 domain-containing protein [Algoriphagus pacificus]MBN7817461.1 RHS repeat-associated core domain-containing protein [Algoriphagus pacificus]